VSWYLALISSPKHNNQQQLNIGMGSCRATGSDIIKNRQERIKSADTISTPVAFSNWAIHCYHCSIHSVDVHSSGKQRSPEVIPKGMSHKMWRLQSFIKRLCNMLLITIKTTLKLTSEPGALEVHCPAEFCSNPNQTHLNKLIKVFRITRKLGCPQVSKGRSCKK